MGNDQWKRESMKELNENKRNLGSIVKRAAMTCMAGLFLASAGLGVYSLSRTEEYPAGSYVPGEVIVNVRDISDMEMVDLKGVPARKGIEFYLDTDMGAFKAEQMFPNIRDEELSEYFIVKVPWGWDTERFASSIGLEPEVDSVTPNYYVSIPLDNASRCVHDNKIATLETILADNIPNDPFYHSKGSWGQDYEDMYGLKNPNAAGAWKITKGDDQVVIAVIDTGVDYTHPDIKDRMWKNTGEIAGDRIDNDHNGFIDDVWGYDFVNDRPDPMDRFGHGTHVAGTIAATTNNKIGVAGINWYGKIMPVKVLSDSGSGTIRDVAEGIVYAADNGAWVINMSLGMRAPNGVPLIDQAIGYADSKGVITVVAAGNDNEDAKYHSPANNPLVITVAAVDRNDKRAYFSNWGEKVDIAAPGVCVISTVPEKNKIPSDRYPIIEKYYGVLSGTSMASPHGAGEVALILSANPNLHGQREAVKKIVQGAVDKYESDKYIGTGRMNLEKAVKLAKEWR